MLGFRKLEIIQELKLGEAQHRGQIQKDDRSSDCIFAWFFHSYSSGNFFLLLLLLIEVAVSWRALTEQKQAVHPFSRVEGDN